MARIQSLIRQTPLPSQTGVPSPRPVPIQDTTGEGLQKFGDVIQTVGKNLLKMQAQREISEATKYSILKLDELKETIGTGNLLPSEEGLPNATPPTLEDFAQRFETIFAEGSDGLSPAAKQEFGIKFASLSANTEIAIKRNAVTKARDELLADTLKGLDDNLNLLSSEGIGRPGDDVVDFNKFQQILNLGYEDIDALIKGNAIDASKGEKLKLAFKKDLEKILGDGIAANFIDFITTSTNEVTALTDDEDRNSIIMEAKRLGERAVRAKGLTKVQLVSKLKGLGEDIDIARATNMMLDETDGPLSGAKKLLEEFKKPEFLSELSAAKRRSLILDTRRFISYGTTKNNAEINNETANVVSSILRATNPGKAKENEAVADELISKIENSNLKDWKKKELIQKLKNAKVASERIVGFSNLPLKNQVETIEELRKILNSRPATQDNRILDATITSLERLSATNARLIANDINEYLIQDQDRQMPEMDANNVKNFYSELFKLGTGTEKNTEDLQQDYNNVKAAMDSAYKIQFGKQFLAQKLRFGVFPKNFIELQRNKISSIDFENQEGILKFTLEFQELEKIFGKDDFSRFLNLLGETEGFDSSPVKGPIKSLLFADPSTTAGQKIAKLFLATKNDPTRIAELRKLIGEQSDLNTSLNEKLRDLQIAGGANNLTNILDVKEAVENLAIMLMYEGNNVTPATAVDNAYKSLIEDKYQVFNRSRFNAIIAKEDLDRTNLKEFGDSDNILDTLDEWIIENIDSLLSPEVDGDPAINLSHSGLNLLKGINPSDAQKLQKDFLLSNIQWTLDPSGENFQMLGQARKHIKYTDGNFVEIPVDKILDFYRKRQLKRTGARVRIMKKPTIRNIQ